MKALKIALWSILLLIGAKNLVAAEVDVDVQTAEEAKGVAKEISNAGEPGTAGASETLRHKDRPVSIFDQPLDGSSIETFTAGLVKVEEEASEKEYRALMSSLDYLLFFDIGANRDKAKLYANLNGLSPNEIRQKVTEARSKKKR
jgi:hypothetical protein